MLWRGLLPESEMEDSQILGTQLPRLSYPDLPGHMVIYFIPDDHGAIKEGSRVFNWAAYIPLGDDDLTDFMVDRQGQRRIGTIPPGKMRLEEEDRLKRLLGDNLPAYYGEIVRKTQDTYVQLIYTIQIPAYYQNRICLIGDAGMVVQPFTGSGVFKGYNNVIDLIKALNEHSSVADALHEWSSVQVATGNRLLALGEQMEDAFIWNFLDLASADAETTSNWWKESVTFPDDFTHESKSR
jgi:2-polyprenyl-6-methoxyphenol hydroxylase-like FAD-dependent oxidoreductase